MRRILTLITLAFLALSCIPSEKEEVQATQENKKELTEQVSQEEIIKIVLPIFEIRTSSYPFIENDEIYLNGPVKQLSINVVNNNGNFSSRILSFEESGNLLSSLSTVDSVESEERYFYDESGQIVSIDFLENNELINTHKYTYERINETDLFVIGHSQKEGKDIYPERVSYDYENSIITSKVTDISTKITLKYYIDKDRIVAIEHSSEFFDQKRILVYTDDGKVAKQEFYRKSDVLYIVESFTYNDSGYLINTEVLDVKNNKITSKKFLNDFDDYGNWTQLEVKKDDTVTLRIIREITYY